MMTSFDTEQQHILIIDDALINLKILSPILTQRGYQVRTAGSGPLALSSAHENPPDLILLDISMPDMDGFEVCERLKADGLTRDIPIIFISASDATEDKIRAFSVGGVDYITKPFHRSEVLSRIRTHLAFRNLQKKLEERNTRLEKEIEERRQAEAALQEANIQLNTLIDAIPDVVYFKDAQGKNLVVNSVLERMLGLEKEKIIGRTDEEILPPDLAEQYRRSDENAVKRCEQIQSEECFTDERGKRIFLDTVKVPLTDEEGNVKGLVGVSRDVTAFKEAQEVLRRQNEHLTALHQISLDMLSNLELDDLLHKILSGAAALTNVSDGFIHLYDSTKDCLEIRLAIGNYVRKIGFRLKPGEGLSGKVLQTGQPLLIEDYHTWEGRSRNPAFNTIRSIVGIPLRSRNRVEGVIGLASSKGEKRIGQEELSILESFARLASVALDNAQLYTTMKKEVTERRLAEKKLKRHIEELSTLKHITETMTIARDLKTSLKATIGIIGGLLGAHGGSYALLDESTRSFKIIAHYSADQKGPDLTGLVIPDTPATSGFIEEGQSLVIPHAQTSPLLEPVRAIILARNIHCLMVVPLKVPGKTIGVIILSTFSADRQFTPEEVRLVETIAGQVAGVIENARLFEEAQKARKEAEHASKAKSEFLANMSHEIRTPMNSVLGFLELALESPDLPRLQKGNLTTAHRSAKSLLFLINDILDVSKLESGRLELEESPFDLFQVMRDTLRVFEIKAAEKGLNLSFHVHPELPRYFVGDSVRLRQIVINLVGNAVKFTDKGGVTVSVAPSEIAEMLHFVVSDTGIGIPPARLNRIFDPFTQADSSTARRFGGTGLGTTISRQLVELMGGRIWVESQTNKGSTFHFTIRLKPTNNMPVPLPLPLPVPVPLLEKPLHSRRCFQILLAEDIEENISLAKIRLEQQGHTVLIARNGREAIELFQRGSGQGQGHGQGGGDEKIDIVFMDIHMPEIDGLEAARHIRELETASGTHVPIIALTASVMKEDQQMCMQAGMDAIISKPIDFNQLFDVMERLIPEGAGKPKIGGQRSEIRGRKEDLWEVEGIDAQKGLQTWQNAGAYKDALLGFCRDYGNAAENILDLLKSGDRETAHRMAHALKGVAGNLFVTDVYGVATQLNVAAGEKSVDELTPMIQALAAALKVVVDSVRQLEPERKEQALLRDVSEPSRLKELFRNMLVSLDEYNPAPVEPLLEQLYRLLSPLHIDPIKQQVERFDFDSAREETVRLAMALGIELEQGISVERLIGGLT